MGPGVKGMKLRRRLEGALTGFRGPGAPFALPPAGLGTPTITSPTFGSTNNERMISISYTEIAGATAYDLQIATDSGFTSLVADEVGIGDNPYDSPTLNYATLYYVRVRATNTEKTGSWGTSQFTVRTWAPTDLPNALLLFEADHETYDDDSLTNAVTTDGATVGGIVDLRYTKASPTVTLGQATLARRPTLKTGANGLNNQPILLFDGGDTLNGTFESGGQEYAFMAVINGGTIGTYEVGFGSGESATSGCRWAILGMGSDANQGGGWVGATGSLNTFNGANNAANTWYTRTYLKSETIAAPISGKGWEFFSNGISIGKIADTSIPSGTYVACLGNEKDGGGYGLTGKVAALLIWKPVSFATEHAYALAYLRTKYNHY